MIRTTITNRDRKIEAELYLGDGKRVTVSAYHYPERKRYMVTANRSVVSGGVSTYSVHDDIQIIDVIPTGRYSAKRLSEIFSDMFPWAQDGHSDESAHADLSSLVEWGEGITPRD